MGKDGIYMRNASLLYQGGQSIKRQEHKKDTKMSSPLLCFNTCLQGSDVEDGQGRCLDTGLGKL
uniref:Uncharacterized protein n=1 Tax=Salix viminalis TaxID=40686 RepID=A0A6N2MCE3_SALVM